MKGNKEVVELWFRKADEDELNIKSILKHKDGTPAAACFLAQQMAEKYLKGLLIFVKNDLLKIHDLVKLEEVLLESFADISVIHNDASMLSGFYVEARYPGDFPEFSWTEAEEAYESAKKIKNYVLLKMGE